MNRFQNFANTSLTDRELAQLKGGEQLNYFFPNSGNSVLHIHVDTATQTVCSAIERKPSGPFQAPPRPLPICIKP